MSVLTEIDGSREGIPMKAFQVTPQKNILLLISYPHIFNACKEEIEKKGCRIVEDSELVEECDFVILDHFFAHAGLLEWMEEQNLILPYVLISYSEESSKAPLSLAGNCYDRLRFPILDFEEARRWISSWLEMAKAQLLFNHAPQKFGSGLWVSVMAEAC